MPVIFALMGNWFLIVLDRKWWNGLWNPLGELSMLHLSISYVHGDYSMALITLETISLWFYL